MSSIHPLDRWIRSLERVRLGGLVSLTVPYTSRESWSELSLDEILLLRLIMRISDDSVRELVEERYLGEYVLDDAELDALPTIERAQAVAVRDAWSMPLEELEDGAENVPVERECLWEVTFETDSRTMWIWTYKIETFTRHWAVLRVWAVEGIEGIEDELPVDNAWGAPPHDIYRIFLGGSGVGLDEIMHLTDDELVDQFPTHPKLAWGFEDVLALPAQRTI